jgi:H+-translocating NAD(P) transhydrogenase subunit beta
VIPIGGADMPVVISLLNSYSGLAACAAGFVILNNVLIVAGALVGASGIILTTIMCKAMNRSLGNVLFSGFGDPPWHGKAGRARPSRSARRTPTIILEAAALRGLRAGLRHGRRPGAARREGTRRVAGGQRREVVYAIHPVAGRMPGHMNVLLAEANVPYDQLVVPEDVNPA